MHTCQMVDKMFCFSITIKNKLTCIEKCKQNNISYFCCSECGTIAHNTFTSADTIVCSIPTDCNGVHCCVDVPQLATSLEYKMIVDTCGNKLRLKVDKLETDIPLHDYDFESSGKFSLYGLAEIE